MASDPEKNVIRRIMTDEEVICDFMEPKPVGSWMRDIQPTWWYYSTYDLPIGWHVKTLTLDALWGVQERLTRNQKFEYNNLLMQSRGNDEVFWGWHATAAQKIKALAAVLRNGEKPDGE